MRLFATSCKTRKIHAANFRRILRTEMLELRQLMASDMDLVFESIPKPPADLVEAERIRYMGKDNSPTLSYIRPLRETFQLHSRPTATKTIYLDYDGFTAVGTPWNRTTPIVSPAWDPAGDGEGFSDGELASVQDAWQRIAADFAPFDVNVTTEDPGEANLVNTGGNDERWGIRVVMTLDDAPARGAGGVAFINSFNWGYESPGASDTPCYVFNSWSLAVSAAASHEIGHSLGLSHDGTTAAHPTQPNQAYYNGHGSGENGWIPIMGSGYYQNVSTWDNGTYFGTNNADSSANFGSGADDLVVITTQNGFDYVPDPEANSIVTAAPLDGVVDFAAKVVNMFHFGVISQSNDQDFFSFQTGSGNVYLNFDPYVTESFVIEVDGSYTRYIQDSYLDGSNWSNNQGANLDILATLYDSSGNVVATSDPAGLRATFDMFLPAGTYYVSLDGVGFGNPTQNPPDGYTQYSSIGQYVVRGSVPVGLGLTLPPIPVLYTEDQAPVQVVASASVFDGIDNDYSTSVLSVSMAPTAGATDRLTFDPSLAGLTLVQGNVQENGNVIASMVSAGSSLDFRLTGNATANSIEKIITGVMFAALGDGPDTSSRSVRFELKKAGIVGTAEVPVVVTGTNDAPTLNPAGLTNIAEDTKDPEGELIADIFAGSFSDPDHGASLAGIAIFANNTPTSQGTWQYVTGNSIAWQNIPNVSATNRLALSASSQLRFLPALNFNGTITPLMVQAIDDSYTGQFTSSGRTVFLPANLTGPLSPVSLLAAGVSITVTPVNDAPTPAISELALSVLQNQLLNSQIPAGTFSDVDDTVFSYSATQLDGSPLPSWLSLSPTGRFVGTPGVFDVRDLQLILTATDSGGLSARLPATIEVINVNDPPTQLRFVGGTVFENQFGVRVGIVNAFDPDGDSLNWSTLDPRFSVRDGELFLNSPLDFEKVSEQSIPLTIKVTDTGSPALSATIDVTIQVKNINEFYPTLQSKAISLPDATAAGFVLEALQSTDADAGQQIKLRLHSGDLSSFSLDPATNELKLNKDLNYKTKTQHKVLVEAYDDGAPSFSTISQFVVNVQPTNKFPPQAQVGQLLNFAENSVADTRIGRVNASDADNNPLKFSLVGVVGGEIDWVRIDQLTGELFTTNKSRFDFESNKSYAIRVSIDEDIAGGGQVIATLPIVLTDVNDAPTGSAALSIDSLRFGAVASPFQIIDQDISATGYTVTTTDSRFEIRNGLLALKSNQLLDSSQVGATLSVPVRAEDKADSASSADFFVSLLVVQSKPWQNRLNPLDVNRDGRVTASDASEVINYLNDSTRSRVLARTRPFDQIAGPDIDVTGDNFISATDALRIINLLNDRASGAAEGESSANVSTGPGRSAQQDVVWLAAYSQLEEEITRRKR
jgi:Dockerin type I domain/Putative Ig domain/Cadherin domain/Metallo-peptidase family M12B Reprolysin-like